ncbi:DEAD/DEAH box helicase [Terrisporobacter mayombei]|uniref:RNA polymerase-associated protein RapA n=1 Tax=Terrisporobacter mayombei TaxID=1541 RepID=A0ABY9PZF1_9FIRM|nr:DEAD/DEAH box helicase [Terrisporobacter mayombei]MCC3868587.1 DEAD/DEAH box helicase [Terrisporobacter mayombei]WMT80744.1 RNA polymerase-associated protein RapA [Terrisporobacter mayombei]
MDFKIVNDILINNTDKLRLSRGQEYYKDGYVQEIKYNNEDKILNIDGKVASANYNILYYPEITIDLNNKEILNTICTCEDYKKRGSDSNNVICKHIVASSLYVINLLKSDVISNLKQTTIVLKNDNKIKRNKNYINKELLDYFKSNEREKVKLDVRVEYVGDNGISCDFKLGIDKMYVMKDLKEFAYSRIESKDLIFGIDFLYNPVNNYFEYEDEKIVQIIEEYGMDLSYNSPQKNFKYLTVKGSNVRRLFEALSYRTFDFKFRNMHYSPSVIESNIPVDISFELNNNEAILKCEDNLPFPLSLKGDVVFYKGDIYLLNSENGIYYKKLHSVLNEFKEVSFPLENVSQVLSDMIPKIENICDRVIVDDRIKDNVSKELKIKYFFDLEDSNVTCKIVFSYDEDNNKFIIKDFEKEKEGIYRLYSNFFEKDKDKYVFKGNDNQLYDFLNRDINSLKNIGEVYYSDKLKERKIHNSSAFRVGLGEEINHYLDFNFEIEGVDSKEYKNIIKAFKNQKRFYKLGDGDFINLEDNQTKEMFKLMESLGFTDNIKNMKIHSSKAMFINHLLTEKKLPYISGIENTNNIIEKFRSMEKKEIKIPKDLHATLRDYQVDSLSWFETLNYLGFGGILADEMGLGKTIQTIAFLLNKKDKKTLIVTPTSLIHNWKSEFEKFAPSLSVGISHGLKKDRLNIIKNTNDFNVILTTYGSLRNDLEEYEKLQFDYCIIDEAQNIKNPLASSTDAVKAIRASNKFALTGTPIENNLMELWSIFDFIMPGYLYSLTKFNAIFIKDVNQVENLKRMIKPFILRRTKEQVIKELPPKIEKEFYVEMGKTQRNTYGIYVEEIKRRLEEKRDVKNKITIFSYLTKLRQLCLDPSIIVEGYKGKSAKTDTCLEIIKDYIEKDNKILVFSQFTSVLKNIGKKLNKNKISFYYLDGSTPAKDRITLVDSFNNNEEIRVFLISLKAGGTGLNLTSANTVIHFDPWWNPSVQNQASDRAHRIGQKQVVEVIKLIAKGTIEEKIMELQQKKSELIHDMIDGNLNNTNILSSLSEEELIDLIR